MTCSFDWRLTDLVQARWTDEIHDEWIRNLSKNEGIPVEQLLRTRRLMDDAVLDCLVTGYQPRIPNLTLPDPNDRHVLAAAIECAADVIVTKNLDDFPQAYLNQFGVEATHPDEFVFVVLEDEPNRCPNHARAASRLPQPGVERGGVCGGWRTVNWTKRRMRCGNGISTSSDRNRLTPGAACTEIPL